MSIPSILAMLPSIPYPPPNSRAGYWAPITSTIDWCEENYYATPYAAEIVNTVTNFLFALLALRGLVNCYREGHDKMSMVTFLGYAAVGIGSFCFHASLKYPMQLVDELSMIYTTMLSCFASFTHRRSRSFAIIFGLFLVSLAIFITGYYHYIKDPKFHQRAYALLTATLLIRNMIVMELSLRPSNKRKTGPDQRPTDKLSPMEKREKQRTDARDLKILHTMWAMLGAGLSIFLGGFAIWQLDNIYCSTLRQWRREIGLPWGILLEGHGWWHIMTGIGAYFYITWGIWLRHCVSGRQDEYEVSWPSLFTSLPSIVRTQQPAKDRKAQ